jgi:glyoxylase-like metal-dependent hydrolase (beta-lactamase superfamily II)
VPDLAVDDMFFGPAPGKEIARQEMPEAHAAPIAFERLSLGAGLELEIYETPGHSPCSCTFRLGRHLIVGDVPFGANPGLAGLIGWSSDGLIHSARLLRHLIERHDITTCWTGHGNAMPGPVAARTLSGIESQVSSLGRIAIIDEDRITLLRQFAVELLHEVERLFTLIGARLMIVAHHLEELEEPEEAARLAALLDFEATERQLTEFREFCEAFERGEQPELSIAMKAAATLGRIRRELAEQRDGSNAALSLAGRAEHLIDAFLQTLRGLSFQPDFERVDLVELITALVRQQQSPRFGADDFLAATDDEAAFRQLLVGNLATSSVLRGHDITVRRAASAEPWDGAATTDALRFQNILVATLEAMVAGRSGGSAIDILLKKEAGRPVLRIFGVGEASAIPPVRAALYNRAMEQIGGEYRVERGNVTIRLQADGPAG